MSGAADRFFDTNVLLCLFSSDPKKASRAEEILESGGVLSVQVLNEFASVALRKLGFTPGEVRESLSVLRGICRVESLTEETHDLGLDIVESHGLSLYDAMIVASARLAGCSTLVSEDLQAGMKLAGVVVRNPFAK